MSEVLFIHVVLLGNVRKRWESYGGCVGRAVRKSRRWCSCTGIPSELRAVEVKGNMVNLFYFVWLTMKKGTLAVCQSSTSNSPEICGVFQLADVQFT